MQTSTTRIVTFEMCGNDGLQARSSFAGQTGTCNYSAHNALAARRTAAAMNYINNNAYGGTKLKVVSNLYYPGYAADNAQSTCRRHGRHHRNKQNTFLPYSPA